MRCNRITWMFISVYISLIYFEYILIILVQAQKYINIDQSYRKYSLNSYTYEYTYNSFALTNLSDGESSVGESSTNSVMILRVTNFLDRQTIFPPWESRISF